MSRFSRHATRHIGLGILLLMVHGSLFIAQPALADGTSCWCRDQAWICTHFRANSVVTGGADGGNITTEQCNAYCAGRGTGTRNIHLDATYRGPSICSTDCIEGGSCTAATGAPGIAALNTCIANNTINPGVENLARCCELARRDGATPAQVAYSGTMQNCAADAADTAPTTTVSGGIRLFNPLGRDVDIPAFIGRGIRGVLGVIGGIALLMFVYGGVTWMTAGDSKRVDDAKNIIKNAVIGLMLIFFSYNIIGVFFDLFT